MESYPYFPSLLITLQTSPSDILLIYEEFSNKFSRCLLCAVDDSCPPSPNLLLEVQDPALCSCVLPLAGSSSVSPGKSRRVVQLPKFPSLPTSGNPWL